MYAVTVRSFICLIRFAQSAGPLFKSVVQCKSTQRMLVQGHSYDHFLVLLGSFLKHLWVPGSTLGALWAHFLNQTSVWGSKGAPRGATPEIKSPFWTHCGPQKSQKSDQNHF